MDSTRLGQFCSARWRHLRQRWEMHGWLLLWWLFVLPPQQRRPIPLLDAAAVRLRPWLSARLGLAADAPPGLWLWRCFVLPPEQAQPAGVLAVFAHLARAAGWLLALPLRLLDRLALWFRRRVDTDQLGRRLDVMALALPTLTLGWRLLLYLVCLPVIVICVTTPLAPREQLVFASITLAVAAVISIVPGKTARVFLLTLSLIATLRYLWWRVTTTMPAEPLDLFCALVLFMAELYAVIILLLGYFQTAWPLNRQTTDLPEDPADWPTVDIFIPTYNEPLKVLRPTVLAALGLDWPSERLNVYILDDGRRAEIRQFAERAGVNYLIRPNNFHAKAGNLNHALQYSSGDYIAIFDCDHIPT
ncbi:MAG: glycosyltransferase, partial [Perlucidibaca sp.]